jgi:hypothetical protein
MTVSSETSRNNYTGSGITGPYSYTFRIQYVTDLTVVTQDSSGLETTLVYLTDYTVSGVGVRTGGSITLTSALASGSTISLIRTPALTQLTNLRNQGRYFPSDVEDALDRGVMIDQEQQDDIDRSLKAPSSDTGSVNMTVPSATLRANKFLAFDGTGAPVATSVAINTGASTVSAFMSGVINQTTAALAQAALGITTYARSLLAATTAAAVRLLLGGVPQVVTTMAGLKALTGTNLAGSVVMLGFYTAGDLGGGVFTWNAADATADNGGTIIQPTSGGVGRWNRLIIANQYHVRHFGAKGDGATDDAAVIRATSAAAGTNPVVFDAATFWCGSALSIPQYQQWLGAGKWSTCIKKGFNGDLFSSFGSYATIDKIWLEGNAPTYTGRGIVVPSGSNEQSLLNSRVYNFDSYCIEFADETAGSQWFASNCDIQRYNSVNNTRFAVKIADVLAGAAYPRKWVGIESVGGMFCDLGGCNDFMVSSSFICGLKFSANSRSFFMVGSRLSNQTVLDIYGANHAITGCDLLPTTTIKAGSDNITVMGNSMNNPIVDESGLSDNYLSQVPQAYTPTLTSTGVAPTKGNGTLVGGFTRSGSMVTVTVEFTIGSTTVAGTGDLRISLPKTPANAANQFGGGMAFDTSAGLTAALIPLISPGVAYAVMYVHGQTSPLNLSNTPWVWATGDIIRIQITYAT